MTKWDTRFFGLAQEVATWSNDPNTRVGAVLVSPDRREFAAGYNGFPRGFEIHRARMTREEKNAITIHAELNAIFNAAVDITGWSMYVTKHPCDQCALALIQKRIARVVCPPIYSLSPWAEKQSAAERLLKTAGIDLIYIGG